MSSGTIVGGNTPVIVTTVAELEALVYKVGNKPTMCMLYEGESEETPIREVLGLPTGADKALLYRVDNDKVIIKAFYLYDRYTVRYSLSSHAPIATRRFMRAETASSFISSKEYSCKYKIETAKGTASLKLSDFGITTYDPKYKLVGMIRFASGSSHNMIYYIRGDFSEADITAGTATVMSIRNDGTPNASDVTAYVRFIYVKIQP